MQAEDKRLSSEAIIQAEENERKRIAADLHDNLGAYAATIASNLDYILVTDPLEGGIYTRAGAIVHRSVADFPAGAQVYVDQTNRIYRVQDQPEAGTDGLTIGEINLVPFSDFNPQIGIDAVVTTGSEPFVITPVTTALGDRTKSWLLVY